MAVKPLTMSIENDGVVVIRWADLDVGDTGQPVRLARYADKTLQATGTATSIPIEGSNDGTNWAPVNDFAGVAIDLNATAKEINVIRENPLYIRPGVVVGGADSIVILVAKVTGK